MGKEKKLVKMKTIDSEHEMIARLLGGNVQTTLHIKHPLSPDKDCVEDRATTGQPERRRCFPIAFISINFVLCCIIALSVVVSIQVHMTYRQLALSGERSGVAADELPFQQSARQQTAGHSALLSQYQRRSDSRRPDHRRPGRDTADSTTLWNLTEGG